MDCTDLSATTATAPRPRKRPPRIVLVVACSQRKRIAPPAELRLFDRRPRPTNGARSGADAYASIDAQTLPTREISTSASIGAQLSRRTTLALKFSSRAEFWVISAGHGLVASHERSSPTAQLSRAAHPTRSGVDHADGDRRQCLRDWLASFPRKTLVELLGRDGTLLVTAGAPYVDALASELRVAAEADPSFERLSVISAGSRVSESRLPIDGRLRRAFGGTDNGLNARVLAFLAASAPEHHFRRTPMAAAVSASQSIPLPPSASRARFRQTTRSLSRRI